MCWCNRYVSLFSLLQYHDNCQAARGLFLHLGSSPYGQFIKYTAYVHNSVCVCVCVCVSTIQLKHTSTLVHNITCSRHGITTFYRHYCLCTGLVYAPSNAYIYPVVMCTWVHTDSSEERSIGNWLDLALSFGTYLTCYVYAQVWHTCHAVPLS